MVKVLLSLGQGLLIAPQVVHRADTNDASNTRGHWYFNHVSQMSNLSAEPSIYTETSIVPVDFLSRTPEVTHYYVSADNGQLLDGFECAS